MTFSIKIAEQTVKINSLYPDVYRMCRDYLTDEAEDFEITVTKEDIDSERRYAADTDIAEGRSVIPYPDRILEETAVYRKICDLLVDCGVILFHSSAVAVDRAAYLFAAPSGVGKSTHVALWKRYFGDRAIVINDDKPLIRIKPDGAYVYGTPWCGKHRLGTNTCAEIEGICFIRRGRTNIAEPALPAAVSDKLLGQTYRPRDAALFEKTLRLVSALAGTVGLFTLQCNTDVEAAAVAYEAMRPKEKKNEA